MTQSLKNKVVLVTGGSGSIGSEIVRQSLKAGARVVRVFSRDETRQYHMKQKLGVKRLRYLIGDVRDGARLKTAMNDVDIVFHAAALKQVPFCEYNPFEAVQTNVIGSQNLVESAIEAGVKRVVAISTDKSVNPVNTMGASKLLSERIVTRANLWAKDTIFSCVRFGNVIGSRGSVVDLIEQQVLQGGPVQLTDKKMTRFMMTIAQAAQLVLRSAMIARKGETFVLPMRALQVKDLVTILRDHFCRKHKIKKCAIKEIGCREGEKLYEELLSEDECHRVRCVQSFFVIENIPKARRGKFDRLKPRQFLSEHASPMKKEEIVALLKKSGVF